MTTSAVTSEEPAPEDWKVQRDEHKAKADAAFRGGAYQTAIDEYSNAIALDPDFIIAYSNRSAAYLKNSEKSKALKDANKIIELDPAFAKGHSRLAAALHALTRYRPAKDAYEKVLELDANNAVARRGVEDCQRELDHMEEEQKRAFEAEEKERTGKASTGAGANATNDDGDGENDNNDDDDNDDDNDDGEDDLLDGFFDEVEEVTSKKKAAEAPKATNAIKSQKEIVGTFEHQIGRLLKDNYEWRNLNPFYVLKLPIDATEDDISRRYKAMALLLHPDKNGGSEQAQKAYDEVKKAKNALMDENRRRHSRMLIEEGMKIGEDNWKSMVDRKGMTLEDVQEKEVMRIFAQVEMKRREVEQRERKFEQREKQQEDDAMEAERKARKFDKSWKKEERVSKRIGNWRDFSTKKKSKSKM
eukprot:CAMPEP_0119553878 /NCGR_PEP_ID=MMETSP1352-20130426/6513_1 /TAXON_ID=265584 /ORGANISM="Stauroneis constricta, Strain CCMP1120" /LENGTH=415 /DNA_ID=CAMNT_0007600361 /DNA_START=58 /DNA_END=1305 /DNA_ORIENTATION=+